MMVGKLIISFWGGLFSGTMLVLGCVFLIIQVAFFLVRTKSRTSKRMSSKHGKMIEVDAVLFFLELHLTYVYIYVCFVICTFLTYIDCI